MPIRISDSGGNATFSAMGSGLTFAADHGARVANISYIASDSSTVKSAAQYLQSKGGVVTSSAGNYTTFDSSPDNPYVLTVSATDGTDTLASWSNTGNNVDLTAPGVSIYSTTKGGGYGSGSGTSFSAPIVAGVAALVISVNPNLSGAQVQDILKQTADDLGAAGWDPQYGYGRVNAYQAVLAASGGTTSAPAVDTIAPTATITAPSNGTTISGTTTITVSASDNVGVTKVDCYINGALAATSATTPASFAWNTSAYPNGSYSIEARAFDAAGNVGKSSTDTVSVQNTVADATAPTADVTAPASGSTVSGTISVSVSGTDNVGVTKVEWYLNGTMAGSANSTSAVFSWNTTATPNGSCTLQARAYDAAGNSGASVVVTVTVSNTVDTTAPTAQVTSPTDGSPVVRNTKVYVTATDNVGVTRVDLLVDGKVYSTSSSGTAVFSWNTSKVSRGSHSLQAIAYDAAGNSSSSAVVTVYK
jgi:hypothetical protein